EAVGQPPDDGPDRAVEKEGHRRHHRHRGAVPPELGLHRLDEDAEGGANPRGCEKQHGHRAEDDPAVVEAGPRSPRPGVYHRALGHRFSRVSSASTSARAGMASTAPRRVQASPPAAFATTSASSMGAPAASSVASAPLNVSPAPTVSMAGTAKPGAWVQPPALARNGPRAPTVTTAAPAPMASSPPPAASAPSIPSPAAPGKMAASVSLGVR